MRWSDNANLAKAINWFDRLSLRERVIVSITCNVVVVAIVFSLLIGPMIDEINKIEKSFYEKQQHVDELKKRNNILSDMVAVVPNDELKKRIDALSNKNNQMQKKVYEATDVLVSPENMLNVLSMLLQQDASLKLISFSNIPPKEIHVDNKKEASLYKHGLKLTVKSDYSSMVRYLKRIDELPWKVYWSHLKYDVKRYPNGTLNIEVFTFSTRKEVLGV